MKLGASLPHSAGSGRCTPTGQKSESMSRAGNSASKAVSEAPEGFLVSWFVRGKNCLFKMMLQGTRGKGEKNNDPVTSNNCRL